MRSFDREVSENPAIRLLGFLDKHFVRMSRGGLLLGTGNSVKDSKTMTAVGSIEDQVLVRYVQAWKGCGSLKP
jgi:hypothetical protein